MIDTSFLTLIPIVLCADDYALAPGVSAAIRDLLDRGRISATSCMTSMPSWPHEAEALRPYRATADIGLHLTLTDQRPLAPMPKLAPQGRLPAVGSLLVRGALGLLDQGEIAAEVERQLDAFEAAMGGPPAFLDGHQHVHQAPMIRDVVLDLFRRRLARTGAYLRYCQEPLAAIRRRGIDAKRAAIISLIGANLARRGRAEGIAGNTSFRGVQDFSRRVPYGTLFEGFLHGAKAGTLIMCHPGRVDAELAALDPVTTAREDEYAYFQSDAFVQTLAEAGVRLARLRA